MRSADGAGAGPNVVEWQPGRRSLRRGTAHDAAAAAVLEIIAAEFGVSREQLLHPSRGQAPLAHARQVAMYLCYVVLGRQQARIGRIFGRHPTTVLHACARIEDLRDDPALDARLDRLEAEINDSVSALSRGDDVRAAG